MSAGDACIGTVRIDGSVWELVVIQAELVVSTRDCNRWDGLIPATKYADSHPTRCYC